MKYGIREICDVVLKAKANQKLGNKIFYKGEPVLYFDTLKTSTLEGAATTVYAQGGRGNSRLIAWDGERTVTFTMEDALISPTGFSILSGAGLIEASENNKIKVHKTEIATVSEVDDENNIVIINLSGNAYGKFLEEKSINSLVCDEDKKIKFNKDETVTIVLSLEEYEAIAKDLKDSVSDENSEAEFGIYCFLYSKEQPSASRYSRGLIKAKKDGDNINITQLSSLSYIEDKKYYYFTFKLSDLASKPYEIEISSDRQASLSFYLGKQTVTDVAQIYLGDGHYEIIEKYYSVEQIYAMILENGNNNVSEPYIPKRLINQDKLELDMKRDDLADVKVGDQFLIDYYTEVASGAQQIEITPDKFGGNYYLEASTLFRDQDGVDHPAQFIIPNCKVQSNFTFTMASNGDPSTFTFTMDAFPDYLRFDKSKKVLAAIQIEDSKQSGSSIVRDRTKSNQKI